jgi:hypothetical protein
MCSSHPACRWLSLLNCFSGGVFLAAGLVHLLPHCQESQERLGALVGDYPLYLVLITLGYMLVLFVERVLFDVHGSAHGHGPHTGGWGGGQRVGLRRCGSRQWLREACARLCCTAAHCSRPVAGALATCHADTRQQLHNLQTQAEAEIVYADACCAVLPSAVLASRHRASLC